MLSLRQNHVQISSFGKLGQTKLISVLVWISKKGYFRRDLDVCGWFHWYPSIFFEDNLNVYTKTEWAKCIPNERALSTNCESMWLLDKLLFGTISNDWWVLLKFYYPFCPLPYFKISDYSLNFILIGHYWSSSNLQHFNFGWEIAHFFWWYQDSAILPIVN